MVGMEKGKAMVSCVSSWVAAETAELSSSHFLLAPLQPFSSFLLLALPCVGASLLPLSSSLPPSLP